MVFLPKPPSPSLIVRQTSDEPRLGDILQDTWPVLKTVKVMKNKERLKICHRAADTEETQ